MFTPATIKVIQDIMRQDIGVDGDATRLSQMVWLIFLKILDDEDKALEIRKEKFVPTLPKKYQWRTWAGQLDGMTGDKLIEFVNNDLLPGLRELPEGGNKRTDLTRMAFQDVYNFMRKGTLLKQVINKINEIDFNTSKDRHAFNEIYERLLKSLQSAGNFGEMYTPRAVTQFIVEMVDPKIGESVLDPAVGTGGFLVHALEHLRKQVKSVKDEQKIQQSIYGVEKKPLPFMLLITNMMLHGIEEPVTMRRGNTLERPLREYTDADKVDCIVTNPPFGGTEEPGIETNFPKEFQTRETADLFLALIIRLLRKHGRAGLVLPDSTLFGEGMKTALKKLLIEECNLHTIVRLPKNVFAPYTSISTNLLFFTKGEKTKEVWYYEHPYPEGKTSYSTSSPITLREFDVEKAWWNKRVENKQAWKVSVEQIKARNYNLDITNPSTPIEVLETPIALIKTYRDQQIKIKDQINKIKEFIEDNFSKNHKDKDDDLIIIAENLYDFIKIRSGIDRLKTTVLKYAMSGRLTSKNLSEGTGEELYTEIQTKRAKMHGGANRKKTKEFAPITPTEIPFEIPKSWKWVRLGSVFTDYSSGSTPSRGNNEFYNGGSTNWYKSGELNDGVLSAEAEEKITDSALKHCHLRLNKRGDLLIAMYGATAGRVAVLDNDGTTNQAVWGGTPASSVMVQYLFYYILQSRHELLKTSSGAAQPNISGEKISAHVLPLPPLAEQKRIVKKVDEITFLIQELRLIMA